MFNFVAGEEAAEFLKNLGVNVDDIALDDSKYEHSFFIRTHYSTSYISSRSAYSILCLEPYSLLVSLLQWLL